MRNDLFKQRIYPDAPQLAAIPGTSPPPDSPVTQPTDSSGFFANLMAKLDVGFNQVTSELKRNRLAMRPPVTPVFGRAVFPVPLNAAGFGIARLGGPDQGHYWHIRSLVIGGLNDPSVATPGRGDVYVSAADLRFASSLSQLGVADWRDMTTTLPNVNSIPPGEMALRLNEELYVVISGGTANGTYTTACSYIDFQESNNSQEWAV